MNKLLFCFCLQAALCVVTNAQIAQGGDYRLEQSVIAAGGGAAAGSGAFTIVGTIGQSIAGTDSNAGVFSIKSGFWTASATAPTAASAIIEGRVLTAAGQGIRNVSIVVTDSNGMTRAASTGAFGYFKFENLPVGNLYTISVQAKKYQFDQSSQVVMLFESIVDLNFTALPN